ncbi:signal peptidase I [Alphaproteobacteria bacterium]|nr:signal peptidase I [Alphaproteobacteria bacterium]GHS99718.1 signal peptidase I [Alphaproteobacteria bacterium]
MFSKKEKSTKKETLWGYLGAIALVLGIHIFIYQPFTIPTGSMTPTLLVGDFIFVRKFAYAYSRYSVFFQPKFIRGRVELGAPKCGDIAVFFHPYVLQNEAQFYDRGLFNGAFSRKLRSFRKMIGAPDEGVNYVKRVIGLPGDRIQMIEGRLHINGKKLPIELKGEYPLHEDGAFYVAKLYEETLPNGKKHAILKTLDFGKARLDNTVEWTVPQGHYFMMGDNRDNSADSREFQQVGFVSKDKLIGTPDLIFFSTEAKWYEPHKWLFALRYKRLLNVTR